MSKRTWSTANEAPLSSPTAAGGTHISATVSPAHSYHSESFVASPKRIRASTEDSVHRSSPVKGMTKGRKASGNGALVEGQSRLPGISRKVKACAACRKQKIKCIMLGDPPCQRCRERGLSCRLNKSLQTLMSEDSRWKSAVTKDISSIYSSLDQILESLNLPALPVPQSSLQDPAIFFDQDDQANEQDEEEQSLDNSPKVTPVTDSLSHVPIESLYQITGLRSLRTTEGITEDQNRICRQLRDTDFIARGLIKLEDAEYLTDFYLKQLDPYIWHLAGHYEDLEAFRRRSPTLTACILTVAALHDTVKNSLYPICNREYRRLVANAMFERKIDMEYLRALAIASYWLSDISWTLSGYAIRRSDEFQLRRYYQQIAESVRDRNKYSQEKLHNAMDGIRILYFLYICDHHLSILYGRSSIMRDNESYINGWETYLACSLATDSDRRIASQLSLCHIMNSIREALGPEDTASVLPPSATNKIAEFEQVLDNWISRFSQHNPSKYIGNWPSKGVVIYYHFAKLYLDQYVFRGLSETGTDIPEHFLDTAAAAVSSATSIISMLLEDRVLQTAMTRVPHFFHGMIAFACMFLLKVATKHGEQLFIDASRSRMLIGGLARLLKVTEVGKEHLIHRMAEGLEKMAQILDSKCRGGAAADQSWEQQLRSIARGPLTPDGSAIHISTSVGPSSLQEQQQNQGFEALSIDPDNFDFGDSALGLGMPFFDFEGTTLGMTEPMYPFAS